MLELSTGPGRPLIDFIQRASREHAGGRARIGVAWAREEGAIRFLDALVGVPTLEMIVGLNESHTTVEAVMRLLQRSNSLHLFFKHPRQTFHPKVYLFDDGSDEPPHATLIVGSSNLTRGGLLTNFEASLVARLEPRNRRADAELLSEAVRWWSGLAGSPFAHAISTPGDLERYYRCGFLTTESDLRRQRRRARREYVSDGDGQLAELPTSPPPRVEPPIQDPIAVPFLTSPTEPASPLEEQSDPVGEQPPQDRFFARTLTPNDVAKLHGRRTGTFEPDLGEMARDRYPAFWGWPSEYDQVSRRRARREWRVPARLRSTQTDSGGVLVDMILWFREARDGHAAEHRIRIGPISTVRSAVPPHFDATSILAFERAPAGADHTFLIRLLVADDPAYADFETYLTVTRPEHRFGYGP